MLQIYNMGPTALLHLRRKACWGFFSPKSPMASAGFEPANLGTKGHHATPRPPKPMPSHCAVTNLYNILYTVNTHQYISTVIQSDSVARSPKLLSIKNYVIEIMIWKWKMKMKKRCKTGPAHNRCWNWSPFTCKHTWMRFSKLWNTFPKFVWGL